MRFLRAIRGALSIGALWSIPWAIAGIIASPVVWRFAHARPPHGFADRLLDGIWIGWYGFLAGLAFSLILAVMTRMRATHDLTPKRIAFWGALSSVLLTAPPMAIMLASRADGWRAEDPFYLSASLILSVSCAVSTLLIARHNAAGAFSEIDRTDSAGLDTGSAPSKSLRQVEFARRLPE